MEIANREWERFVTASCETVKVGGRPPPNHYSLLTREAGSPFLDVGAEALFRVFALEELLL